VSDKSSRAKGSKGEEIVRDYLRKQGMKILDMNFRVKIGEIDIIAKEKDTLVFVEVKSATSVNFGNPLGWVTPQKQQRIVRVSQWYLMNKGLHNASIRFDVVSVDPDRKICHVRDAFRPESEFSV